MTTPTTTRTCQCGIPATSPGPFVLCSHCDVVRPHALDCGPCARLRASLGRGPRPDGGLR